MNYPKEFVKLVKETNGFLEGELLGVGNPASSILLVGKEPAIQKGLEQQRKLEIENNYEQWKFNLEMNTDISTVLPMSDINDYNPLYPYKGQKYKVRIEEVIDGKKKVKQGAEGTSKTWYQYQKLWDCIRFERDDFHSGIIDYHEHCFSTELSSANEKYSSRVIYDDKKKSIEKRKGLLCHPFYQGFPIVILAVGHYPKEHGIDLESIFQTKWDTRTRFVGRFWYNIHHSVTNKPKLLIHTNQLSMVSNVLIKEIAERCIDFKYKHHLKL